LKNRIELITIPFEHLILVFYCLLGHKLQPITFDLHFINDLVGSSQGTYTLWCLDENFIITLCEDEKKYLDSHKDGYVR